MITRRPAHWWIQFYGHQLDFAVRFRDTAYRQLAQDPDCPHTRRIAGLLDKQVDNFTGLIRDQLATED